MGSARAVVLAAGVQGVLMSQMTLEMSVGPPVSQTYRC
jgi:hypothetical protein